MDNSVYVNITNDLIKKWSKILLLDPLWNITVEFYEDLDMENALARLDTSMSEYYKAILEISSDLFLIEVELFKKKMDSIICHELLHILMLDFYRASVLMAENEKIKNELRYRYEQTTTRLQNSFINLIKKESGE
jgi:hypothetical protein